MADLQPAHEILRATMIASGLNQSQFAKSIGFHATSLIPIFKGKSSISPLLAYAVQQKWGLDALELLNAQSANQLAKIAREGLVKVDRRNPKLGNRVNVDEDEVVKAYVEDHVPVQLIADDLGVSYGTIWRILHRHEVPMEPFGPKREGRRQAMRPYRNVPPPIPLLPDGALDETTIIARYEEGYSSSGIAEAIGGDVTWRKVIALLHRRNVTVRPARTPTASERLPGPPVKH